MKFGVVSKTIIFLSLTAGSLIISGCDKPPEELMTRTEAALKKARQSQAAKYAPDHLKKGVTHLDEARLEVARQKGRLAPLRNFDRSDSLLRLALTEAISADSVARVRKENTVASAEEEIQILKKELDAWREALDGTLVLYRAEKYWSAASLDLSVSRNLYQSGEYEEASQKARDGREDLDQVAAVYEEFSGDNSRMIKSWREWVRETVNHSKTAGTTAVIVDKMAHRLYLIKSGKILHQYPCELGYNSARQKMVSGDGATPEGKYVITKVNNGSKFYRALLINYPNDKDRVRYSENKRKGIISRGARIGGLIEIHGHGGRNEDWTDGCIALTNQEMDHLMKYVTPGTPVVIVRKSDIWP